MIKKIISITVLILFIFSLSACGNDSVSEIERITGVELPKEMEIVYDYYYSNFQGDFTQYTVFKLSEEPTSFLNENLFSKTIISINSTFDYHFPNSSIPEEYHPDWGKECLSGVFTAKKRSTVVFALYYPDTRWLIFLINGT